MHSTALYKYLLLRGLYLIVSQITGKLPVKWSQLQSVVSLPSLTLVMSPLCANCHGSSYFKGLLGSE